MSSIKLLIDNAWSLILFSFLMVADRGEVIGMDGMVQGACEGRRRGESGRRLPRFIQQASQSEALGYDGIETSLEKSSHRRTETIVRAT